MSTATVLFLVLIAIYLNECCRWLPHEIVAFVATVGRWRRFTRPSTSVGSSRFGLVFSNPLVPHRATLTTVGDQFALSPQGVAVHPSGTSSLIGSQIPQASFHRWSEINSFRVKNRSILVGDSTVARFAAGPGAQKALTGLVETASLDPLEREGRIRARIALEFDAAAAADRITRFESFTLVQGLIADLLFFAMIMLVPALATASSFATVGLATIFVVAVLCVVCGFLHYRAARKWSDLSPGDALIEAIRVGAYPPAALRSLDSLGERVVEDFHPLAVAAAVCSPPDFQKRASEYLRSAERTQDANRGYDSDVRGAVGWYQAAIASQVRQLLRSRGLEPETTAAWIGDRDPSSRSYCPSCGRQYTVPHGSCHDCAVGLTSFE